MELVVVAVAVIVAVEVVVEHWRLGWQHVQTALDSSL